jgi:hypothetical protein
LTRKSTPSVTRQRKSTSRRTASYQGPEVAFRTIPEFAKIAHIGINQAYALVRRGEVRAITLGGQKRISDHEIARLTCGDQVDASGCRWTMLPIDQFPSSQPAPDVRLCALVDELCRFGPRSIAELLLEISHDRPIRDEIEAKLAHYIARLGRIDPAVLVVRTMPPVPIHAVPSK